MPANHLKWSDARRLLAVELHEEGRKPKDIAAIVRASVSSVYEWLKRAREQGKESLLRTYTTREAKLSAAQHHDAARLLDLGAQTYGFEDERWTLSRVRRLIEDEFGVIYHLSSVHRILHELGFSC